MIDFNMALLDLRADEAYQAGHYRGATHIAWPELQTRLNELPERPARLQLLGDEHALQAASRFLAEKGYQIDAQIDLVEFEKDRQKQPGLVVSGKESRALWHPTPLLSEFIESQLDLQPGLALDLGCGGGRDSVYLAQTGWQVIAIDREQRVLKRAQQLAESTGQDLAIEWKPCCIETEGCLPAMQFDLIVMMRFLNRPALLKMAKMLKPGGHLVIQTFVEGVERLGSPKNPNFILKKAELKKTFGAFQVIVDRIDALKDGRPVVSFIAKKRGSDHVRNELK